MGNAPDAIKSAYAQNTLRTMRANRLRGCFAASKMLFFANKQEEERRIALTKKDTHTSQASVCVCGDVCAMPMCMFASNWMRLVII